MLLNITVTFDKKIEWKLSQNWTEKPSLYDHLANIHGRIWYWNNIVLKWQFIDVVTSLDLIVTFDMINDSNEQ